MKSTVYCYVTVGLYLHKRKAATHILAILISHGARNLKPYSLPVQLIAYSSINEAKIRLIINKVVEKMTNLGMKVSGILICISYDKYS